MSNTGENVRKVMAILLFAVLATATLALVVTSKQAKFTKVSPLFKRRVAWATKEKKAFPRIKVDYLVKNRIFVWSWLKFVPLFSQWHVMFSTPRQPTVGTVSCLKTMF